MSQNTSPCTILPQFIEVLGRKIDNCEDVLDCYSFFSCMCTWRYADSICVHYIYIYIYIRTNIAHVYCHTGFGLQEKLKGSGGSRAHACPGYFRVVTFASCMCCRFVPYLRIRDQLNLILQSMQKTYKDLTAKQGQAITSVPNQPLSQVSSSLSLSSSFFSPGLLDFGSICTWAQQLRNSNKPES